MTHSGVVYKFRTDAAYYTTIIDRYYGQHTFLRGLPVRYGIISLAVVGAFLGFKNLFTRSALGIGLAVVVVLAAGLVALTKLATLYRFKRRADFGAEAIVTLSRDAITSSGRHAQGQWGWQAYPRSVRYPDGILLMRRGVIRWLPDSALQQGTAADATALVRSKTVMKEAGRHRSKGIASE